MNLRYGLVLALSLLAIGGGPTQGAAPNHADLRRVGILSALTSRASREGVALPVGLCSVVRAIGFETTIAAAAPSAIAASLTGDSLSCPARGGAQQDEPWRPFIEIAAASVSPSEGAPQSVTVHLRIWARADDLRTESYDFVVSRDSLWTPKELRQGRVLINLSGPADPNVVILLNDQLVQAHTPVEVFERVRGQVLDSIRVFGATDTTYAAKFGSRAATGGIIIGTHPAPRRP